METTTNISTVSGKNLMDLLARPYLGADRHAEIRTELARRAATGDARYCTGGPFAA